MAAPQTTCRSRVEIGKCICPLSLSVHHNYVRDGRYSEGGWASTPHPQPAWANFFTMMECTPESGRCPSVYWVCHCCCTVNKQRSLNLLFSSMFCTERKIVHVGAEKIITLYY